MKIRDYQENRKFTTLFIILDEYLCYRPSDDPDCIDETGGFGDDDGPGDCEVAIGHSGDSAYDLDHHSEEEHDAGESPVQPDDTIEQNRLHMNYGTFREFTYSMIMSDQ